MQAKCIVLEDGEVSARCYENNIVLTAETDDCRILTEEECAALMAIYKAFLRMEPETFKELVNE